MFGRKQVAVNRDIAQFMRGFYADLTTSQRNDPNAVATAYARHVWSRTQDSYELMYGTNSRSSVSRPRHYVGLSTTGANLDGLTKQVALIADTLVLSHLATDPYYRALDGDVLDPGTTNRREPSPEQLAVWSTRRMDRPLSRRVERRTPENRRYWAYPENLGFHCPDLAEVGRWLLGAEPLVKAGYTWYLPEYVRPEAVSAPKPGPVQELVNRPIFTSSDQWPLHYRDKLLRNPINDHLIDFLERDGRIVDVMGADPVTSMYVRTILRADLPFIAGVDLGDFSRITVDEFDGYERTRNILRNRMLDLDDALNDTQSEKAIERIRLEINDEIERIRSDMRRLRRQRRVAVTQAVVASVGATLVAVYGPVFQQVVTAVGASGGLWMIIKALADNSPRELRSDKWYYAWVLDEQRRRD